MKRWRYGEKEREREREREREKNIFLLLCLLFIIFEASNVAIMKEKEEEAKKKKEAGSGADNADAAEASDEEIGEGEKYICSFDYSANEDNELSFLEGKALETTKLPKITVIVALLTFFYLLIAFVVGDIIIVLDKFISNGQPAGWWKCELNGVVGLAPSTFITKIN